MARRQSLPGVHERREVSPIVGGLGRTTSQSDEHAATPRPDIDGEKGPLTNLNMGMVEVVEYQSSSYMFAFLPSLTNE
jgi:hypothetical protein